jgi:hypothetical protein
MRHSPLPALGRAEANSFWWVKAAVALVRQPGDDHPGVGSTRFSQGLLHEQVFPIQFQVGSIGENKKIREQPRGQRLQDRRGKTVVLTNNTQPVPSSTGLGK